MTREQFEHAIRAAGAVLGVTELTVIGSQALHGSMAGPLPIEASRSVEVDVAVRGDAGRPRVTTGLRTRTRSAHRERSPRLDFRVNDSLRSQLQHSLGEGYSLERELGAGGMSRVFLARNEALGREVVVKVLSPERAVSLLRCRIHTSCPCLLQGAQVRGCRTMYALRARRFAARTHGIRLRAGGRGVEHRAERRAGAGVCGRIARRVRMCFWRA